MLQIFLMLLYIEMQHESNLSSRDKDLFFPIIYKNM